jgi:serine/threonine-protein kinase ULK/ATG1
MAFSFKTKCLLVSRNKSSSRLVGGFSSTVTDPLRRTEENYQEDCLPFILDDDSSGPERSTLFSKKSSIKSTFGFDLNRKLDKAESTSISNNVNCASRYSSVTHRPENTSKRLDNHKILGRNLTSPLGSPEQLFANPYPKGIVTKLKFLVLVRFDTFFKLSITLLIYVL